MCMINIDKIKKTCVNGWNGYGQWTTVDVDKDNTEFKMKYIQFLKSVVHILFGFVTYLTF